MRQNCFSPEAMAILGRTTPLTVNTRVGSPVAGELGALLDQGFFAQDLPKLPPNVKTASESLTEAV